MLIQREEYLNRLIVLKDKQQYYKFVLRMKGNEK